MEPELDPLPLPPLRGQPEPASAPRLPWHLACIDLLSRAWPLIVMAGLAVTTTWLLRQADRGEATAPTSAPRHVPDYEMRGFSIQRHVAAGLSPSVVEGDQVRHYPDTDTLEIDRIRVRWIEASGQLTLVQADHAVMREKQDELLLEGRARLTRPPVRPGEDALELWAERLRVDTANQVVRSDRPVRLQQGENTFEGGALLYDHRAGVLSLSGSVRGRVQPNGGTP